ncbi:MAG: hypothetical protein QXQ94_08710 [Candidatus Bathyarchaeia archaeon]
MSETKIYLDPKEVALHIESTPPGYLFNITFWVENVTDLAAWQVTMYFNDSIINATRWFEPTWDNQYVFYGKTTIAGPTDSPHPSGGYYITSYSHADPFVGRISVSSNVGVFPQPSQTFNGTGKLAIVEFNVTLLPKEGEIFSCTFQINNSLTYLLNSIGKEIQSTKDDGYYTIPEFPLFTLLMFTFFSILVICREKAFEKNSCQEKCCHFL